MKNQLIIQFSHLGKVFTAFGSNNEWKDYSLGLTLGEYEKIALIIKKQFFLNPWFTEENVRLTLKSWGELLNETSLKNWTSTTKFSETPKRIGLIMAGNIPMVGFHDFLSVLLSGNKAVVKLSSNDNTLLPVIIELLIKQNPILKNFIEISSGKLGQIDGIIATGSNNSMTYFQSYFGHIPHLFRKNRTSIAILSGNETEEELYSLGKDIFTYFGLGCRNVSQLFIPKDFELNRFFEGIIHHSEIVHHNKYANNYDYNKAIHLMNQVPILDNGFVLLKESDELFSPLAMLFYHRYENQKEIESFLDKNKNNIQAIVGKKYINFGESQYPKLTDYADGVDTMKWLGNL
jgi:hypothetical protein